MRQFFIGLLLSLCAVVVSAQPTPNASVSSAKEAKEPPSTEVAVLRAQLETTKQFQDSFLTMAQWTLGSAIAVALALGAFAWHTNKSNYERDKESIQREAKALATELRAEVLSQLQGELKKLEDGLGTREQAVRESVEKTVAKKFASIGAKIDDVENETLDLKERSIEREAEESLKNGRPRWAARKYCELMKLHVKREMDQYFSADVLDKLRAIAKDPSADLDAETVSFVVQTLTELPPRHQPACEPIVVLFKKKLG